MRAVVGLHERVWGSLSLKTLSDVLGQEEAFKGGLIGDGNEEPTEERLDKTAGQRGNVTVKCREERDRASVERLRCTQAEETSSGVRNEKSNASGTSRGSVPDQTVEDTVRQAPGGVAPRGHRALVGENCHGVQLDGGLTMLADYLQKVYSLQTLRTTSKQAVPATKIVTFQV
ncbi:hypothetical protein PInf_002682 [Phytophthora infestans]|nr:hypothetical protein PInf_002668 [Phytophthora infestans]KAI9998302.1 hypothetical protein PInf_002682 [Phytophthora infestans]